MKQRVRFSKKYSKHVMPTISKKLSEYSSSGEKQIPVKDALQCWLTQEQEVLQFSDK